MEIAIPPLHCVSNYGTEIGNPTVRAVYVFTLCVPISFV